MVKCKCFSKKSNEQSELACLEAFFSGARNFLMLVAVLSVAISTLPNLPLS